MQLYYVKHKLMKRIGRPLYLLHDHYHEEHDVCTIEQIKAFGDNVIYIFTYSEVVELTHMGFDFDKEWKIISLEDFYNEN